MAIDLVALRRDVSAALRGARALDQQSHGSSGSSRRRASTGGGARRRSARVAAATRTAATEVPVGRAPLTRGRVDRLAAQETLTRPERRALIEHRRCNRCRRCGELKMICSFPPSGRGSVAHTCISCRDYLHNTQSRAAACRAMHATCRARARRTGKDFDLAVADLEALFRLQGGLCAYSGRRMELVSRRSGRRAEEENGRPRKRRRYSSVSFQNVFKASVDRIDPDRGYTRDNVHLVCLLVNFAKLDLQEEDFLGLVFDICDRARTRVPRTAPLVAATEENGLGFRPPSLRPGLRNGKRARSATF